LFCQVFATLSRPTLHPLTHHFKIQASSDKKHLDIGANLFIGNLDDNVDERLLYDTFSAFGMMATTAKVRVLFSGLLPCLVRFSD
jgi:RNA recognition motif-containing protein